MSVGVLALRASSSHTGLSAIGRTGDPRDRRYRKRFFHGIPVTKALHGCPRRLVRAGAPSRDGEREDAVLHALSVLGNRLEQARSVILSEMTMEHLVQRRDQLKRAAAVFHI